MFKKVAVAGVVLLVLVGVGGFFWARAVLGTDAVRTALASQLSTALGQPVTIEGVHASIYPRVTVALTGVTIGNGDRISVKSLDVGTALGALFSRRIEHATLRIADARLQLPLPNLAVQSGTSDGSSSGAVELVSIDEIVLTGIELVSRGRTVRGDVELVPHGTTGMTVRRVALTADGARIDATGEITDLAGPVGTLDLKAGSLDLDQLLAFATDFMEGAVASSSPEPSSVPAGAGATAAPTVPPETSGADLTISLAAERATMSGVALEGVAGTARLQGDRVTIEPMTFSFFGGSYEGTLGATMGADPTFTWKAAVRNVDMAAVTAFVGNPGVLTGRLAARFDLTGNGVDAARAMQTARGTATVTIANGVVQNLALVKSAVAATSLNPQAVVASSQGPRDEPFSELGATLAIAGGTASTQDLHFVSNDIRLDAGGAFKLDGSAVTLQGALQLSEALSRQANSSVVRVTQQDGKITLPATVRGVAGKYSIQIDTASMAKRALTNEAKSQAESAVKKGLGRLLNR